MLNNSNEYGAPIWNPNLKTKFEFKSRKKKKKTEKGNEEEGLAAGSACSTSRPSQPNRAHLALAHERTRPTSWPSTPQPPARFPVSLAAAATGPHASATLQHSVVFLTHASTAYATGARQRWQGGTGGHARGMTLSLPCVAPTPPHASHWMPLNMSPPLDHRPSWEHEARL